MMAPNAAAGFSAEVRGVKEDEMKRTFLHGVPSLAAILALALVAGLTPIPWLAASPAQGQAQSAGDCSRPFAQAVTHIANVASGHPTPTRDGCWVFAGFVGRGTQPDDSGIAVLRRKGDTFEEVRTLPLRMPRGGGGVALGMALTSDEEILVVSAGQLSFFDVGRLTSGEGDPLLGRLGPPRIGGSFGVTITRDDRHVLASQIGTALVAIVDLQKARTAGFDQNALAGIVRTAPQAIIPVASPDGRFVFTTTVNVPEVVDGPRTCAEGKEVEGAIQIADLQRAIADPASATIAFASPAGCRPQSLAVSPDGARLSATAGGQLVPPGPLADNSVVVFDTRPLLGGKPPALIAKIPVPSGPVGLVDTGSRIIVGFIPRKENPTNPMVIDTTRLASGKAAILGTIPAPAMDLAVSADGRTLFGSQGGWTALAVVDLERVKLDPVAP
jgi:DNA-binding beta-propeller fold protein YncE